MSMSSPAPATLPGRRHARRGPPFGGTARCSARYTWSTPSAKWNLSSTSQWMAGELHISTATLGSNLAPPRIRARAVSRQRDREQQHAYYAQPAFRLHTSASASAHTWEWAILLQPGVRGDSSCGALGGRGAFTAAAAQTIEMLVFRGVPVVSSGCSSFARGSYRYSPETAHKSCSPVLPCPASFHHPGDPSPTLPRRSPALVPALLLFCVHIVSRPRRISFLGQFDFASFFFLSIFCFLSVTETVPRTSAQRVPMRAHFDSLLSLDTPRATHHPPPHLPPTSPAAALSGEQECVLRAMEHIVFVASACPRARTQTPIGLALADIESDADVAGRAPEGFLASAVSIGNGFLIYNTAPAALAPRPSAFSALPEAFFGLSGSDTICDDETRSAPSPALRRPSWSPAEPRDAGVSPRECARARGCLRLSPSRRQPLSPAIRRDADSNATPPPRESPLRSFDREAVEMPELRRIHTHCIPASRRRRGGRVLPLASGCTPILRLRRADAHTLGAADAAAFLPDAAAPHIAEPPQRVAGGTERQH
ncbi:hypothetical protein C8R44DRAFT_991456 [Mycena epipterygia]|nr:hypothetical protein C8R44DRAFT_991456 [Mycena epipterygia]